MQTLILCALGGIIILSAIFTKLNTGILAIAAAFLFGIFGSALDSTAILAMFPTRLFFIIFTLALFFGMLSENGTVERATEFLLQGLGSRVVFLPLVVFLLVALLTSLGVSNIAVTGLMAPIAMRLAQTLHLSPLLMSLLIVGAASGAALSPLSLSGAIVQEYVSRNVAEVEEFKYFAPWRLYFWSLFAQGTVAFAGFHLMGGTKWVRKNAKQHIVPEQKEPRKAFEKHHVISTFVFFLFVAAVSLPNVPFFNGIFSTSLIRLTENIAIPALLCAALLMLFGVSHLPNAISKLPWNTIFLIVGMSMFIQYAEHSQALSLLSQQLVNFSTPQSVFFLFPFASALLSAFSSSSGVVLPLFLPLTVDFSRQIPNVSAVDLVTALSISSHMVDASPLSTLGALCISALNFEDRRIKLFRQLFVFGMLLIPGSAIFCWILF